MMPASVRVAFISGALFAFACGGVAARSWDFIIPIVLCIISLILLWKFPDEGPVS